MANPLEKMDRARPTFGAWGRTPEEFAQHANERCKDHPRHRSGELRWVVDYRGQVVLETNPEWLARYNADQAAERERERQRFNWRLQHPVDDPDLVRGEAA